MIIRDELPADRQAIHDVVSAAFGQEDEARLVDALRADGDSVCSLVVAEAGTIVGPVQF